MCLSQDKIPTYPEIQSSLGLSLAEVFSSYCHPKEKELLRSATENDCGRILCDSSSDCLDECVNVHKTEKIKACTHQDVLDIGSSLLEDFQLEIEKKAQTRLEKELAENRYLFEAEKRQALETDRENNAIENESNVEALRQELEEKYRKEIDDISSERKKEMQKAVVRERLSTTREMLRKMRQEVCHIVASLYDEFQQSNRASRERMIADFNEIRRREHVRLNAKSREFESKTIEALQEKIRALEKRKMAEICGVLCYERSRHDKEKQELCESFKKRNEALQDVVSELYDELIPTKKQLMKAEKKRQMLEEKFGEMVGEFKKLINFLLDAKPGQADYLLSPNSLCLTGDQFKGSTCEDNELRRSSPAESDESPLNFCACVKRADDWSRMSLKSFVLDESFSRCSADGKDSKKLSVTDN